MTRDRGEKKKRIRHEKYIVAACLLLAAGGGLTVLAAKVPKAAQWYTVNIYPYIVSLLGRLFGLFPFSVAEVLLYMLAAAFLISLGRLLFGIFRGQRKGELVFAWFSRVFLGVGILALSFVLGCGINYHRDSFSQAAGIETGSYSVQELEEVCLWLTQEVNQRSAQVTRDGQGSMQMQEDERARAVKAMEEQGKTYSCLRGYYPRPKGVAVSEILSYQGLTGVYSPFTVEANYNADMPDYNVPFTLCHELSHLRGFMQEQEANFIAFLACTGDKGIDFQYSGYLSGWVYCMNTLYDASPERWSVVRGQLSEEAEADLKANSAFWDAYDGTVAEVANQVNDSYLKANGQEEGVHSYDKMVDLIVAYYYKER